MKELSKDELKFKRALKKTFKKLSEYQVDWYISIRKYESGGFKFYIFHNSKIGSGYVAPYYQYGDCSSDISTDISLEYQRPKNITMDFVRGLMSY